MEDSKLKTPVLFLVFNRMDTTKRVFEEIRKAKPTQLFVAADGPRTSKEKEKTDAIREYILKNIDWNCKTKTLFRDKNLGCGKSVSSAINWFFENVEQGIILEDDCMPSQSFFKFCQELLKKYKEDKRIMQISGTNVEGMSKVKESYFFSERFNAWGWATWKRAWRFYDYDLSNFRELRRENRLESFKENPFQSFLGRREFTKLLRREIDTWDYQWILSSRLQNGLCIIPKRNLIKNLGFNEGTHTSKRSEKYSLDALDLNFPLEHPNFIFSDVEYDNKKYNKFFSRGRIKRGAKKLFYKITHYKFNK